MPQQSGREQPRKIKVLLVAQNPAEARPVWLALSEARGAMEVRRGLFAVTWADGLASAVDLLAREEFDAVLLDLQLSDADGRDPLAHVSAAAANVPVVVLAGADDDGQALAAIGRGAQDYLAREQIEGRLLRHTIRHAIERRRAESQLLRRAREIEAARARIERQAEQLRARADQLDRINRELDDFAYLASHDLKEPLRGIKACCELLREEYHDKLNADGQRRLGSLVTLCDRLETLIGDLLTYCRVGGTRPAETGIELTAVLCEVLQTLQPTIDRRHASVRVVGRMPTVTGDSTLIGMAISNLVSNGLKFNDRARPQVEIGCRPTDPPTIYVRDDGIGIAEEHHEAIFKIFRRLHGRKKYEGTGAGLTIVRKIVESHGGRIWLESEPGEGSTFFFTLAPDQRKPAAQPAAKPPHWGEQPCRLGRSLALPKRSDPEMPDLRTP